VDDALHLSHDTKPTMEALRKLHELKQAGAVWTTDNVLRSKH
jgi:hypothetical protein